MAITRAKQNMHPLDKATAMLYVRLDHLGPDQVHEYYQQRNWDGLGRNEFCEFLGSPEAGTNFFLTAVELWLSQKVDSTV